MNPNIIATSCSSSGAGLTSLDWDGWIKLQNVTYNDATGKLGGWAWGSEVVGWIDFSLNPLAPSQYIVATPCEIPKNGTFCTSVVTWISQNFWGATSVLQGATEFHTTQINSVGENRAVTPENKIFVIKDMGGVFSFQTTANVTCQSGSDWNAVADTCEENVHTTACTKYNHHCFTDFD